MLNRRQLHDFVLFWLKRTGACQPAAMAGVVAADEGRGVENIPMAKENYLIMSPFLHDFKEYQPKYSILKINFPKTDANLAPKCQFLGVYVKNTHLAKESEFKKWPLGAVHP